MLHISNVSKILGGQTLFENIHFQINEGEKIGLVGANGTGKTTLFNLITRQDNPDEGQIGISNSIRMSYFSQRVGEMAGRTALEEVIEGNKEISDLKIKLASYESILSDPSTDEAKMNDVLIKMGDVQTKFEKIGGYEIESNAEEILSGLGILPIDHSKPTQDFSGGWKMRIALAKVLIVMPDLILMDEPTNYLDLETIIWLEKWLKNFKGAVLMTSHDRVFMNKVVDRIVEISNGGVFTYSGNYDFYEKEKEIRKKQNKAHVDKQNDMLKKEEDFIARFQARASHAAQVQSRVKKLEKIERVKLEQDEEEISILLPEISRGGNDVAIINNLSKTWNSSTNVPNNVFSKLTTIINRQDKIAVVGVNGAGKSTFLKIIAKQIDPTDGSCELGPSIKFGYFGQFSFEMLNGENTIYEELQSYFPDRTDGFIRNILAGFLFKGDDVFKKIKYLSGGEQARVVLAWLLTKDFNFLILDEPTNHLDIKSRRVFLDALKRYKGTIVLVSHDRYFLDHLVNKVMEVDKGKITTYVGTYKEYCDKRL